MGFRWPTMPGSGGAQVAQQIGAIGAGIGVLGEAIEERKTKAREEFEEKQARVRLDDFKLRVTKRMIELGNEIAKEQDEDKYQAMMDSAFSDLQGQIPKGMAGPLATSYLNSEKIAQLMSVDESKELRVESKWAAQHLVIEQEAIESTNPIPFEDSLDTGLANGYIDEEEAEVSKQRIGAKIKEALKDKEEAKRRSIVIDIGEEVSGIEDGKEANKRLNELIKEHQLSYAEQNEVRGRISSDKAARKEAKEARDNEVTNNVVDRIQRLDPKTADYINANVEDGVERDRWLERFKTASNRRERGDHIVNNERERGRLLDLAASIAWPERQVKVADVRRQANEARYDEEIINDEAYNEVMDAVRKAEVDKHPFTESQVEKGIGELMTGAPSSIMGLPLDILRTREDHIKHATNLFGRFATRIPGVMETINAKFPPPPESAQVEAAPDNPAYDFDGESIGYYNTDGSITLNREGVKRLFELAGGDIRKAREMAGTHRYIIPEED